MGLFMDVVQTSRGRMQMKHHFIWPDGSHNASYFAEIHVGVGKHPESIRKHLQTIWEWYFLFFNPGRRFAVNMFQEAGFKILIEKCLAPP